MDIILLYYQKLYNDLLGLYFRMFLERVLKKNNRIYYDIRDNFVLLGFRMYFLNIEINLRNIDFRRKNNGHLLY